MMPLKEKIILGSMSAVAGITAMLIATPPAHADALTFIQGLNDNGIMVYDTSRALTVGTAICNALNTTNGVDVARNLYRISSFSDVPTPEVAAIWVVIAAQELCPWQDHSGTSNSQSSIGEAYAT